MFKHTDQSDGRPSQSATTEQTDRLYIGGGQSGLVSEAKDYTEWVKQRMRLAFVSVLVEIGKPHSEARP